jgi:hypothetical protein
MFCHQSRKAIIPQTEHQQLAAILAENWGGGDFAVPAVGLENLAAATYAHDRCYGELDRLEIGKTPRGTWLELRRRGLRMESGNPIVEALFCMHNMCLLKDALDLESVQLYRESQARLREFQGKLPFSPSELESAFSLQRLCDEISYRSCRGEHARGSMVIWRNPLSPRWVKVDFEVLPTMTVTVKPWPFKSRELKGKITGYRPVGYLSTPQILDKQIIDITVTSSTGVTTAPQACPTDMSSNPLNPI